MPERCATGLEWLTGSAVTTKSSAITLMQQVSMVATRAQQHDRASARTRWLVWIQEGPGQGLGRQHKMSRCATGWIAAKTAAVVLEESELDDVEGIGEHDVEEGTQRLRPLDQQQTVDEEASGWAEIWQAR